MGTAEVARRRRRFREVREGTAMRRVLGLALLVLLSCSAAVGQTPVVQPPVTITLVQGGNPISGRFVRADPENVVVIVGPGEMSIKTKNVATIQFQPVTTASTSAAADRGAATTKILSALRRLDNAVEV